MTITELQKSDKAFLIPTDISAILGVDPHSIRIMARDCPDRLGFPVVRIGTRTKIPRIPFLAFLGVEERNES